MIVGYQNSLNTHYLFENCSFTNCIAHVASVFKFKASNVMYLNNSYVGNNHAYNYSSVGIFINGA